jgi:hypothetical protein
VDLVFPSSKKAGCYTFFIEKLNLLINSEVLKSSVSSKNYAINYGLSSHM